MTEKVGLEELFSTESHSHMGINWFECAPSWCEKVDLKQF